RAGGGQGGLDVLADLADLRPHVALADAVAVLVARQLTGDEDHAATLDRDHVRAERVATAGRRGKRLGLDVVARDWQGVSLQEAATNARPTTRARRTFPSIFEKPRSGSAPTPSSPLLKKQRAAAAKAMSRTSVSEKPWRRRDSTSAAVTVYAGPAIFSANAIIATSAGARPA